MLEFPLPNKFNKDNSPKDIKFYFLKQTHELLKLKLLVLQPIFELGA